MISSKKGNEEANQNEIMTSGEVAAFLKVSVSAVRRWTRTGTLKGHRLGSAGDYRYLRKEVMDFLLGKN